jgi:VanZ family protein
MYHSVFQSNLLQAARIAAWSLAIAIVVLSVIPPDLRPETAVPHNFEHFLIYSAAGLAFALGYECKPGLLAALLLIFTGSVEFAQLFVPGPHARLSDFIIDAAAAWAGLVGVTLYRRLHAKGRSLADH